MDLRCSARRCLLRVGVLASVAGTLMVASTGAHAQDATTYSYDALGRLVSATTSGGPNNGIARGTCFDAAGNRTQYVVGTSGAPCTVAPNAMLTTPTSSPVEAEASASPTTLPSAPQSSPQ